MSLGLLARKIGMTQLYDDSGALVAATVLEAGSNVVVQRKTAKTDGYEAMQLGLVEARPAKRVNKPLQGHFKKANTPPVRLLREFRLDGSEGELNMGEQLKVDTFAAGERVHIKGLSKGKGFQGVMKRHNFRGGAASHGSMFHRAPGSIGASSFPSRVFKGTRMGGHMGSDRVTTRNLKILKVDGERNLLLILGSVPGATGAYVSVHKIPARASAAGGRTGA